LPPLAYWQFTQTKTCQQVCAPAILWPLTTACRSLQNAEGIRPRVRDNRRLMGIEIDVGLVDMLPAKK